MNLFIIFLWVFCLIDKLQMSDGMEHLMGWNFLGFRVPPSLENFHKKCMGAYWPFFLARTETEVLLPEAGRPRLSLENVGGSRPWEDSTWRNANFKQVLPKNLVKVK